MKKMFLSVIVLSFVTVSCTKELAPENECEKSMASIAGTYKVSSIQYKEKTGAAEIDLLQQLNPCEQDDIIILKADGTAEYRDISMQCSPNQSYSGSWSVHGYSVTMNGDKGEILSYDCKKLVIKVANVYVLGDQVVTIYDKQ